MAAFILGPLLTELGITGAVSTTAAELTGSAFVGGVLGGAVTGIASSTIGGAIDNAVSNSVSNYSSEKLIRKFLPEEFSQYEEIYTGQNLKIVMNDDMFILTDELGKITTMPVNKSFSLPALFGTFVGPNSPNNNYPVILDYIDANGNVYRDYSRLDLFAAFHDADYDVDGHYFNNAADLKFIARILNNFDMMTADEKKYAKISLLHFTTFGKILSNVFGSDISDDVFKSYFPEIENKETLFNEKQKIIEEISTAPNNNYLLINEFLNMQVYIE